MILERFGPTRPCLAETVDRSLYEWIGVLSQAYSANAVIMAALANAEQSLIAQPAQSISRVHPSSVPGESGVYVFTLGDSLAYAGSTIVSLRQRFRNFARKSVKLPDLASAAYRCLPLCGPAALALERAMIDTYKPTQQGIGLGNNELGRNRAQQTPAAYLRAETLRRIA